MQIHTLIAFITTLAAFSMQALAQVPDDLILDEHPLPSGTYQAYDSLTALKSTVQSGEDITFRSEGRIRLLPGFRASAGSRFVARINAQMQSVECPPGDWLCDMPPEASNARFDYENAFKANVVRPALSLRGFDSEREDFTREGGTTCVDL